MANKKSKKEDQIPTLSKGDSKVGLFFDRFHSTIFTLVAGLGLSVVIGLLFLVVINSSDTTGHTSESVSTHFDTTTINRVEQLDPLSQPARSVALPNGTRTNPFK